MELLSLDQGWVKGYVARHSDITSSRIGSLGLPRMMERYLGCKQRLRDAACRRECQGGTGHMMTTSAKDARRSQRQGDRALDQRKLQHHQDACEKVGGTALPAAGRKRVWHPLHD